MNVIFTPYKLRQVLCYLKSKVCYTSKKLECFRCVVCKYHTHMLRHKRVKTWQCVYVASITVCRMVEVNSLLQTEPKKCHA